MYLKTLSVSDFRNLAVSEVQWSTGFNYLYGANGAGKTAVLEAIHLLSLGRSFRTRKSRSLVAHGANELIVRGLVESTPSQLYQLAMSKQLDGKTTLRIDGENKTKVSEFARKLPVQVLLPDTSDLVLGAPQIRRSLLDWGLFHVEHSYLAAASEYSRVLAQRNAWLKTLRGPEPTFDPWAEQLLSAGLALTKMREEFVLKWTPSLSQLVASFSLPGEIGVSLKTGGLDADLAQAEKKLSENWPRDVKFGATHSGPHRGDLIITIEDRPAGEVLSRGQAKLVSSALVLAQIEILKHQFNLPTVVLIDDYGAELDANHWVKFSQTLRNLSCQVIATSNGLPDRNIEEWADPANFQLFHVEQGRLTPEF